MEKLFQWNLWKKTPTKIRVAYLTGHEFEEIIISYLGENYRWSIFSREMIRSKKRHSRISYNRWTNFYFSSYQFKGNLDNYKIIEVKLETILKIANFWSEYLRLNGIINLKWIGSVMEK